MNEQEQSSAVVLAQPKPVELQLTATEPDEIKQAQTSLIEWAKSKIAELEVDAKELEEAHTRAVTVKWKSAPIKRLWDKALKRIEFYKKLVSALEHGYVIIPNFPVTLFAIRTHRKAPLRLFSNYNWEPRDKQKAPGLPEGEGEYQNPFPVVQKECIRTAEGNKPAQYVYSAEAWKDIEFPIQMAKPQIMEATTQAMALNLFDEFGIMPERKREDPIIVAHLVDPSRSTTYTRRVVTFMIAWHLNTRDL